MAPRLDAHQNMTRRWTRLLMISMGLVIATWVLSLPIERTATAQDDPPAAEAADPAPAPASPKVERLNLLSWMIQSSGIFGFVLLLMSFVMVALVVMNALQLRRDMLLPAAFIEEFEQRLGQKDHQGAYDIARGDESFLARVVTAGLGKLTKGYQEAVQGMQEAGDQETMDMEHRLSYLALIGSVAPMVGLMGTVYGMILTFQKIAGSDTSPKPRELAEGISTALFTTLEGLMVAIPAMVGFLILRNRMSKLSNEVGVISEGLMSPLSNLKKTGGAAPTPAPAAPKQ